MIADNHADAFRFLGWTVTPEAVTLAETIADGRTLTRQVAHDGTWTVADGNTILAGGTASHICAAACDANEVFWLERARAERRQNQKPTLIGRLRRWLLP